MDLTPASALTDESRTHLTRLASSSLPLLEDCTPEEARANSEAATVLVVAPYGGPVETEDITVAGGDTPLAARLYRPPAGPWRADPRLPALVYLHGGGWVIGSLDGYDDLCRRLAVSSDAAVISVDYRLAPEHPFPAPVEDAVAATRDVLLRAGDLGIDATRVAVGGDSAGGALATVVARRAAQESWPMRPVGQLLIYPAADSTGDWPSVREFGADHCLTAEGMRWFWQHYVQDPSLRDHPDAAPLHAADLGGMAPAHVLVASHDVLRDEGLAYARALDAAGVPVTVTMAQGLLHGFIRWTALIPEAEHHIEELGAVLRHWYEG
jgi:acetyl esterase